MVLKIRMRIYFTLTEEGAILPWVGLQDMFVTVVVVMVIPNELLHLWEVDLAHVHKSIFGTS
jgi:hypothetical protein